MESLKFYNYNYQSLSKQILELKKIKFSKNNNRRLCFHKSERSKLHCMLIELKKNSNFPMHYHRQNDEIFVLLRGDMEIVLIEKKFKKKIRLNKSNNFIFLKKNVKHRNISKNGCLYLEVKLGPFKRKDMVFVKNEKKFKNKDKIF